MKVAIGLAVAVIVSLGFLVTTVPSFDSLPKKESPGKCQLSGKFLECIFVKAGK